MKAVGYVAVSYSDPNYTAPCLELINKKADFIYLGTSTGAVLRIVPECIAQGFTGSFGISHNSFLPKDLEKFNSLKVVGGLYGFPWWADAPAAKQYRDVLKKYGSSAANPDTVTSTNVWSALELFRKAMTDHGPAADKAVTSADVINAYHQVKDETLDGLLPQPLTFAADGPQPLIKCFWMFSMQNGKVKALQSGTAGNGVSGDLASTCFDPK
jgi:branched-chain amino acid transport system substrate-binding protein